jgi:hypothetical protein
MVCLLMVPEVALGVGAVDLLEKVTRERTGFQEYF